MAKHSLSDLTGVLDRYPDFASHYVVPRNVDVWLPPGYGVDLSVRYPVIYMHDGQNLFDPGTSYAGVDWGMDEAVTRLALQESYRAAIVVGVWNAGAQRWREYMPQRPFNLPSKAERPAWYSDQHAELASQRAQWFIENQGGLPFSDQYLRFLVEELKPVIDTTYRSLPGLQDTIVMGSSMGGLISLYALLEYPQVFGRAGCLSTHWPAGPELLLPYIGSHLPPPGRHRLYFDYGTETLDASYEPYQLRVDGILQAAGYIPGRDTLTLKFPGDEHSEQAWRDRVDEPLRFLLGG